MKHTLSIIITAILAITGNLEATLGPVQKVAEGLFSAEATLLAGETIYLGMQQMSGEAERNTWQQYSNSCYQLTADSRGWLYCLGTFHNDPDKLTNMRSSPRFSDMDAPSFDALVANLQVKGIIPDGNKWKTFNAIRAGLAGFSPELCTYVAYISTKPITESLSLLATPPSTFNEVQQNYKHIIMSVGVTLAQDLPLFENRGIFRNPLSLLEGGHSNIATLLHTFTAKALKSCINQDRQIPIEYFIVRALPEMRRILEDAIGVDHIRYANDIPENLCVPLSGGYGGMDTSMLVQLDDLAVLHD